jgi:hypothetical protein
MKSADVQLNIQHSARQQFHQARQRQGQPRDEVLPGLDSWRTYGKTMALWGETMGKLLETHMGNYES